MVKMVSKKFLETLFVSLSILTLMLWFRFYNPRRFKFNIIETASETIYDTNFNNNSNARTIYLGDQERSCYTTVVATLFLFGKSKHSHEEYEKWSSTMIKSMGAPIIALIDFNWEKKFIQQAQEFNLTGIVYITKSIWDIMKEFEKKRKKEYTSSYKEKQLLLDGEKHIHSPELYAVWNLKTYILREVARKNPFKSEFFIYTDSGAWRGRQFRDWPDESMSRNVAEKIGDRILYGQIGTNYNSIKTDLIQGTFFAGTSRAISQIYDSYYNLHDEWLENGLFVGKDQNLMNELAFRRANSSIARLRTRDLNCTSSYNWWFFYQYYFAHSDEYICNEDRLSLLMMF